jgi:hypothetical protein
VRNLQRWKGIIFVAAVASVAGASTCSNVPTEPVTLDGTFTIVTVDGHLPPMQYDSAAQTHPYPHARIIGGTAEFVAPDTIWLTTRLDVVDAPGHVVSTPTPIPVYIRYTRSGDSLYNADLPGPLGAVAGNVLHLRINYPAPPSTGYFSMVHDYTLEK